jgi:hypothetical protein
MNQIPPEPPATRAYLIPSQGYCPCDGAQLPSPAEAERTSARPDGDEMRAGRYADVVQERNHAREERDYWRGIAETVARPRHLVAVPARPLSDIDERTERTEAQLSAALDALRDARAMIAHADESTPRRTDWCARVDAILSRADS